MMMLYLGMVFFGWGSLGFGVYGNVCRSLTRILNENLLQMILFVLSDRYVIDHFFHTV